MIPISIVLGLGAAAALVRYISAQPSGSKKMTDINKAIKAGAKAYLKRQYKVILAILSFITILLYLSIDLGQHKGVPYVALSFFLGTLSSIIASYISMEAATRSNVKVAEAARKSQAKPLQLAFYGGLVLGLSVVSMSLIGVTGLLYLYWWLNGSLGAIPQLIIGYGFGASLAALFMQLGGGIYTKSADVGADLVGKIEAGIPEDDPRNPAVIADNVGDNVGDCAGRGADLFESISAENIGSMIIGAGLYIVLKNPYFIFFPIVARAVGLIATMVGALAVRPSEPRGKNKLINPVASLRNGLIVSSILIAISFYFVITEMLGPAAIYLYYASLMGLVAALIIEIVTEYYTGDHKPVKNIADAAKTGPATTVLMGLSVGMESTALPVIIVVIALGAAYLFGAAYANAIGGITAHIGGIYGTVTATIGMLSLTGIILAIDGYGPIADNAGGIVEMSGIEKEVGDTANVLDAAGNTTKSLAKGFAMGSAVMASLLLFQAYLDVINQAAGTTLAISLMQPSVIIGLLVGGMMVFLFAAMAISAVGKTASVIIEEVRRQFKEIPGILKGRAQPEYGTCVDITTKSAQKNMIAPSLLVLVLPIVVGLLLGPEAVGGLLLGVTITGATLAFTMNTGGAAFDNAKKYMERIGLKNTEQHKATVVGDTVGDPLKDTAGPSIHILLKLVNNIAIVMGTLFVLYSPHLLTV